MELLIPPCPPLGGQPELSALLHEWGHTWAACPNRPQLSQSVKRHWSGLIDAWVNDSTVPLFLRKNIGRGGLHRHPSGRAYVHADNTPAVWTFSQACQHGAMALTTLRQLIGERRVPVAMAWKGGEKSQAVYQETMKRQLNDQGWKLCHIEKVGTYRKFDSASLGELVSASVRFLDPSNMFLVPAAWGGLGEAPEVIEAIRQFEASKPYAE